MTNTIGKMLKEARKFNKLTQVELARKVGKKRSYIARIESGDGSKIKFKTLTEVVEKGFNQKIKIEFVNDENINQ